MNVKSTVSDYLSNPHVIALVGIMAATVECGKLVLSFIPNVEIVTLLVALFGYCFGVPGVMATVVFVCIEPLIYGFGPWVITYLIYWPLLAIVFMILGKSGVKSRIVLTVVAVAMTVGFGLLSSVVDCVFYFNLGKNFLKNLILYYSRGAIFYVVQIGCNLVLFLTVFRFLSSKIQQVSEKVLNSKM